MSDENPTVLEAVRDTVILDEVAVLRGQAVIVQCAALVAEPDAEHPDGVVCGAVIETPFVQFPPLAPDMAAETFVECPECSKRLSDKEGRPMQALIALATLIGSQVRDTLAPEPGDEDEDGEPAEPGDEDEDDDADEMIARPAIVINPEDQGPMDTPAEEAGPQE